MSDGYNGWANYETWLVALWLDNEQMTQDFWQARAEEMLEGKQALDESDKDDAVCDLSSELKDSIEEGQDEACKDSFGLYRDLLRSALESVDWREIAKHYIEAAMEELDIVAEG